MNWLYTGTKILCAGQSSSGKTTWAIRRLRAWKSAQRIFVFDPESEWTRRMNIRGFDNLSALAVAAGKERILIYTAGDGGGVEAAFENFCEFVFGFSRAFQRQTVFVCDELQRYTENYRASEIFLDMVRRGRRYCLDFLFVSGEPNLLPSTIRTHLTEIVAFQQTDPLPLKFSDKLGIPSASVMGLKHLEFLHYTKGKPIVRGKLTF